MGGRGEEMDLNQLMAWGRQAFIALDWVFLVVGGEAFLYTICGRVLKKLGCCRWDQNIISFFKFYIFYVNCNF